MLNHHIMKNIKRWKKICVTYLFLLLIKIVYDDTNEEVEGEKRSKYDKHNKI